MQRYSIMQAVIKATLTVYGPASIPLTTKVSEKIKNMSILLGVTEKYYKIDISKKLLKSHFTKDINIYSTWVKDLINSSAFHYTHNVFC